MKKLSFLLIISFFFLFSCGPNGQELDKKQSTIDSLKMVVFKQDSNNTVNQKPDYSDATTFWNDFKKFAIAKNYSKIAEMTNFPFTDHMTSMDKANFLKNFTFHDDIIERIKNAKTPTPEVYNGKTYLDVDLGGPSIFIEKINGVFKFTLISYGE